MKKSKNQLAKAQASHVLAMTCWQNAEHEEAIRHLKCAIVLAPHVALFHTHLAMMLKNRIPAEERVLHYQAAIRIEDVDAHTRANCAALLLELNRFQEAEESARRATVLAPDYAEAWFNLGEALTALTRYREALDAYCEAANLRTNWALPWNKLAKVAHHVGKRSVAVEAYRRNILCYGSPLTSQEHVKIVAQLQYQLGSVLAEMGEHAEAQAYFVLANAAMPNNLALLIDLGNAASAQAKYEEARVYYHRAISTAPTEAAGYTNLGTISQTLGRHEEAIAYYRKALTLSPNSRQVWSNLCISMCYSPRRTASELRQTFDDFDRLLAMPLRDKRAFLQSNNPQRRLRVAYVSADFRRHAVAYFALPLLQGHSKENVELICYYNHRQVDTWTEQFKAVADEWVDCVAMDDEELALKIRDDRIDILVDLSGHTEGNRLLVFARKPAPIQVTWMGYVTSTGLSAMDYRLTHIDADPIGAESHYSERLVRLPGTMWCYRPLNEMPQVAPPPCLRRGHITFGSFNRYSKVSQEVLSCWVRILLNTPNSHLILCLPEGEIRQELAEFFASRGVSESRLHAYAKLTHEQFWALHSQVDIALDTFPFNGGTTTCETLWLGVPLVTCTGGPTGFDSRFASRMSYAFLSSLGLRDLAGKDEAEYVEIAINLARDVDKLINLRKIQRTLMENSALTDEPRFVREVEVAYRIMWRDWCQD